MTRRTCETFTMDEPNIDEALEAARGGAEWAISILFQSIQPDLLRFLSYRARDVADDLASETWLAVAQSLPQFFGSISEFRALLFTIARRRVIDHYRKQARQPSPVPLSEIDDSRSSDDVADHVIEAISSQQAIDRLIAKLPDSQAEVIILRVVAGLSSDEVAKVTGRSAGAVRVLQHRALARLVKEFSPKL